VKTAMQLTIDGGEVPFAQTRVVSNRYPLSERQSDILAWARLHGGLIRPIQAGVLVHARRPSHMQGAYRGLADIDSPGEPVRCCKWASKDGLAALKRLMGRGIVERVSRGLYVVVGW
jgi:hypothetical protein